MVQYAVSPGGLSIGGQAIWWIGLAHADQAQFGPAWAGVRVVAPVQLGGAPTQVSLVSCMLIQFLTVTGAETCSSTDLRQSTIEFACVVEKAPLANPRSKRFDNVIRMDARLSMSS